MEIRALLACRENRPCLKDFETRFVADTKKGAKGQSQKVSELRRNLSEKMGRQILNLTLKREAGQKWGFGLTGGKDVSLTFRIEKVALASPAGNCGLKNLDYLIKVNGREVFDMKHQDVVRLIKEAAGDTLELEVER